ncbi:HupE/UreJ family protein [Photobacterium iliopiscarium]|uniref:Uncharacterized protein n=1 Tax=Photobacterium iliopiscarium TaxID=56192 RepID=A0A2T3MNP6_9GAMM|nr:HupE/UreJ family protein [Photobacterium iliopiscarium]PSV98376.1 hypothetical protein C9I88_06560 [Photobacterium iliopiscarium]
MSYQEILSQRLPWLISFLFELFGNLGFASALKSGWTATNPHSSNTGIFFNIGVEIEQLIFQQIPLYIIGIMASFWFIQRVYIVFH